MKSILLAGLLFSFMNLSISCQGQSNHIKSVAATTEVFGDGQKVTAAAIEYDKAIKNSSLSAIIFL